MTTAALPTAVRPATPVAGHAFDTIVCAVDAGSHRDGAIAAAIAVAPSAAALRLICVSAGAGARSLDERRGRQALAAAQQLAATRGLSATTQLVHGSDVAAALLERAGARSLLVAGARADARRRGAEIGAVAAALAQHARGPLLLARPLAGGTQLGVRILAAVDDSEGARSVARLAGTIAVGCGGFVHLIHAAGPGYGASTRHRLAELSTELIALTGAEPVVDVALGTHAAARICEVASCFESGLVVVGRGRRAGPRALGSVSARVVQAAPCSVLVAPAAQPAVSRRTAEALRRPRSGLPGRPCRAGA